MEPWEIVFFLLGVAAVARIFYEYIRDNRRDNLTGKLRPVIGKPGVFVDTGSGEVIRIKALESEEAMEEFLRTGVIPRD